MITILTLANKPALVVEAMESVARQTRRDFRHIVERDVGQFGKGQYPPACFANKHIAQIEPDGLVAWLSDDDCLEPIYIETLAGFLDMHPEVGACYGGSRVMAYDGQTERHMRDLPAERTFDAETPPSCKIDGGQMLVRRSVLDRIAPPWVPEVLERCNIADGSFMNRVAAVTPIVPVVGSWVMRNRMTPLSSHWRLVDGVPQFVSPQTVARLGGGHD